jgi:two-component system, OmpR family, sensor kinase
MRLRPKLGLLGQLYLAGILLLLAAPALLFVVSKPFDPPWRGPMERDAQHAVADLLEARDRARVLRRIQVELGVDVELLDEQGRPTVPKTGWRRPTDEQLVRARQEGLAWGERGRVLVAAPKGGDFAFGLVQFPPPAPPGPGPLALLGVVLPAAAIFAFILSRSLGRPIARLAETARSFAQGDLRARSGIKRNDELGELARAFDEMAERLATLVRSQKELLANISHELRTPLSRIHVAVELAEHKSAEEAHDMLLEVGTDLCELERLVEDVLALARLDLASERTSDPLTLHRREHLVREIVKRSRDRFQLLHPERVLDVQPIDSQAILTVNGDLLVRALTNLLDNAAKYSDSDTHIALDVEVCEERVTFTVRDRGIGISAEDLLRVGTPFFRTEQSRSQHVPGIGLGLSLARRVVEAHGGTFSLEGELGAGTAARIRLNLEPQS